MSPARERLTAVLALLALAGVELLASTQPFATVRVAGSAPVVVTGSEAAPALAPLAVAQLALAGALSIAGRLARPVLGAVLLLIGAGVVASLLPAVLDPLAGTRGAVAAAVGVSDADALVLGRTGTAWPAVGAAAGGLSALAGVGVLVRGPRWSTGGRRFRAPAPSAAPSTDPIAEWDALTRGDDPTRPPDPPAS